MPTALPQLPPLKLQQQTPPPFTHTANGDSRRRVACRSTIVAYNFSSPIIKMGMQSSEGTVMFSSIALLQQRFRELERIKEKRERLLQMLAPGAATAAAAAPKEAPVKWFFHPELLYPCRPLRDTAAAAALFPAVPASTACECKTFQLLGDSLAVDLWPSKAYKHVSSEVDVDTSLHL